MAEQNRISKELNQKKIGAVLEVISEGWDEVSGAYFGRSYADAPEIDGKVYFRAKKNTVAEGEFVRVRVTEAVDYDLVEEIVK